jgi:hypothetical protein
VPEASGKRLAQIGPADLDVLEARTGHQWFEAAASRFHFRELWQRFSIAAASGCMPCPRGLP